MMFKQSSGDLLLAFCDLMSVSWQIMVDDKVTGQHTPHVFHLLARFPTSVCLIIFSQSFSTCVEIGKTKHRRLSICLT